LNGGWPILLLLVPGFFVGWLFVDRVRRPFNEDPKFMRKIFHEAPVTVIAGCTTVGTGLIWVVLTILRIW
jgi:hypothetical protein